MNYLTNITDLIFKYGSKLLLAIFVFGILYYITHKISKQVQEKIQGSEIEQNKYTTRMSHLISNIIFITLILISVLITLEIIGMNTALILGAITITIGFAMENTIGNMIAGVMLLTNPHLKVGESIFLLGDIKQIARIEEFHLRYTVLRTLQKQRFIIPNSKLLHTPIQTKKTEDLIRGSFHINIARHYDIHEIFELLKSIINRNEKISYPDQTDIHIHDFNKKGYELVCYYFYNPQTSKTVDFVINSQIRTEIVKEFQKRKISFSYPHQNIKFSTTD